LKTVFFYRDFRRFAGHHLKVFHYFNYILEAPDHTPVVRFSRESLWDESNLWRGFEQYFVPPRGPVHADMYFFSGMDWRQLPREQWRDSPSPVVNYIQSVRHAWPENPRYEALGNRAIRISVSPEVTEAISATGLLRGPLFTIPAAIDVDAVIRAATVRERDTDLAIVALKSPELGHSTAARLTRPGRTIRLIDRLVPRQELLDTLARSRVTLFLPFRVEGKPLPLLEGMALETIVVCPDCVGNRSFCHDGVNSFRPPYEDDAIFEAAEAALSQAAGAREAMLAAASATVREHDLPAEREAFYRVLGQVDELWDASGAP
jgi:glycosyltransferase involved in cell wall biosynthesis